MFEGAQGVLLDIDHGTYPFVTSSSDDGGRCVRRPGHRPDTDRHGAGNRERATPRGWAAVRFRPSSTDATGDLLRKRGNEFGSVTGRPRRCGWLDVPALRLAVRTSGIQGLALTKLDVLAGLERVQDLRRLPPGWRDRGRDAARHRRSGSGRAHLRGARRLAGARRRRIRPPRRPKRRPGSSPVSASCWTVPVWATSWGPGRSETILTFDPFAPDAMV